MKDDSHPIISTANRSTAELREDGNTRVTNMKMQDPSSSEPACLVLIYPSGAQMGKRFTLDQDTQIIGRINHCEIPVDLDSVSRRHAILERRSDGICISDLDSTNGTYVNQMPIQESMLNDGDQIKIGNAIFKFLSGGNVEAGYHEAIYRITIIDGLTDAYNKRYFEDFLDRELARGMRYKRPLSLVMYDLDHFKEVNDRYGHLAGDFVLREISRRLKSRIRREEILARYGGEEFVVVLPETDQQGALEFAEQIRLLVERDPIVFEDDVIPITISVGVATMDGTQKLTKNMVEQFIKIVDDNLYMAKDRGRNCVVG